MPRNFIKTPTVLSFAMLGIANNANAQIATFFPNDATINSTVAGVAIVGYANGNDIGNPSKGSSPTINLVKGSFLPAGLKSFNSSTINVFDGSGESIQIRDSGVANITGGSYDFTSAVNNAKINIMGGSCGIISTYNNSLIKFSSGDIDKTSSYNNSVINITGGSILELLGVYDSSTLNLYGTGLQAHLINSNFEGRNQSQYELSGKLADGTPLVRKFMYVSNGTATFTLNAAVPEPGSMALFIGLASVGVGFLRRRRRK